MAAFGRPFALGLSAIGGLPDFLAGNPDRVDVHASNQAMIGVQLGEILRRAGGELSIAPKDDARIVLGEPGVAVKMKVLVQKIAADLVIEEAPDLRRKLGKASPLLSA